MLEGVYLRWGLFEWTNSGFSLLDAELHVLFARLLKKQICKGIINWKKIRTLLDHNNNSNVFQAHAARGSTHLPSKFIFFGFR